MLHAVPGAYFWVGHDGSVPVHNPGYVLDDKILPIGASMFARIIETRLPAGPAMHEETASNEACHLAARSQRRRPDRGLSRPSSSRRPKCWRTCCRISRCGSRTSRRCTPSIPKARARPQRHRPNAGSKAEPHGPARRRARDDQGQHRHQGRAGAAGRRHQPAGAGGGGCAAGGAAARGGRGDFLQDHHAGLRHAVVGPVELSSPHPQSLGPLPKIPAAPVPARARPVPPATARCISAPISAARCGCRRAGAAWSG